MQFFFPPCACHEISHVIPHDVITRITFRQQYNPAAPHCTIFPVTVFSDISSLIKFRQSRSNDLRVEKLGLLLSTHLAVVLGGEVTPSKTGTSNLRVPVTHRTMSAQRSTADSNLLTAHASYEPNE